MTASTVHVSNISSSTSDKEIQDFFSFCGKISSCTVTPSSSDAESPKSATITFERDAAAKTALLLDQTQLGTSTVHVSSAHNLDEIAGGKTASHADEPNFGADTDPVIRQENKPRSAIFAELLSHGYVIGDQALAKGIELDKTHGIWTKFTSFLNNSFQTFDQKFNATDKAKTADEQYHITDKVNTGINMMSQYFEKAAGTATGRKLRQFYEDTEKQILDIHNEAKRLADERKAQSGGDDKPSHCTCNGSAGNCTCPSGSCACDGCAKPGPKEKQTINPAAQTGTSYSALDSEKPIV